MDILLFLAGIGVLVYSVVYLVKGLIKKTFSIKKYGIIVAVGWGMFIGGLFIGETPEVNVATDTYANVEENPVGYEILEEVHSPLERANTDVFQNARMVTLWDLTDDVTSNLHVSMFKEDAKSNEGLAAQQVLDQTFHFIQQKALQSAEYITITVGHVNSDGSFLRFTVDMNKFEPNDHEPMSNLVLQASEVEVMSDDVKNFFEAMDVEYTEKEVVLRAE